MKLFKNMETTANECKYHVRCPHCNKEFNFWVYLNLEELVKLQSGMDCPFCSNNFKLNEKSVKIWKR